MAQGCRQLIAGKDGAGKESSLDDHEAGEGAIVRVALASSEGGLHNARPPNCYPLAPFQLRVVLDHRTPKSFSLSPQGSEVLGVYNQN